MLSHQLFRRALAVGVPLCAIGLCGTSLFSTVDNEGGVVTKKDWHATWNAGFTGWQLDNVNPALKKYFYVWIDEAQKRRRILVPLAGKTMDLAFLGYAGHDVVGVEMVEKAITEFQSEQQLVLSKSSEPLPGNGGSFDVYSGNYGTLGGEITMLRGNLFHLDVETVGQFERVWDRAALVAIEPSDRERYAQLMADLVPMNGRLLMETVSYDQSLVQGPPWSVPPEEVVRLYSANFIIKEIEEHEAPQVPPRFKQAGVSVKEHTFVMLRADRDMVEELTDGGQAFGGLREG